MIGSQPTDSKNSSDNRRFTTDTISNFRGYYESHLKGNFSAAEQHKIEERIFLKDIQLETLHSNFSSGQITQEQLIAKIKESVQTNAQKPEEDLPKLDEVVRRNVVISVTQRSNLSSSGPMPEIRLSGVLNGDSSVPGPVTETQKQPQKLKSTPELATLAVPPATQSANNFKHNLLNFVLQHEGLSYEIIDSFLKHQKSPDHAVAPT